MPLVLEFLSGSLKGEVKKFDGRLVRIGRDPQGDVVLDYQKDPAVSFNHAVIEGENDHYELKDLGSTNGTLVNGKKINHQVLVDGDLIAFGLAGPKAKVRLQTAPEPAGATKILFIDRPKLRLEVIRGPGQGGKFEFELHANPVVKLGREKNNDISFYDPPTPIVSRYHAELSKTEEGIVLEDLGSTNGTFVNGKKITSKTAVKTGDRIVLGANGPELLLTVEPPKSFASAPAAAPQKIGWLIASTAGIALAVLAGVLFLFVGSDKPETSTTRSTTEGADELASGQDEFAYVEKKVKELAAILREDSSKVKPSFVSFVMEQINLYKRQKRSTEIILGRAPRYLPTAMREFKKKKFPRELAYLAFIESGYDPNVRSKAGAVGLWQFMIPTAKQFGLKVDLGRGIDERTNPHKATEAAVKYLDFLFREKHSMFNAIASYNTGQGSVSRAYRKVEDPMAHYDYFYLSLKGLIPAETRDYVPRFLAAAIISSDPARFGFSL